MLAKLWGGATADGTCSEEYWTFSASIGDSNKGCGDAKIDSKGFPLQMHLLSKYYCVKLCQTLDSFKLQLTSRFK